MLLARPRGGIRHGRPVGVVSFERGSAVGTGTEDFADLVIHVGYHKAGSTLLQRRLFIPERGIHSPWPQAFYHCHVLLVRPDATWPTTVRTAFAPGIDEARHAGLRPVLSCEALSGDLWRVGQANGFGNFHIAEMLAEAFPGAQVVLVHREQNTIIGSLYKHSVRSHWRYSVQSFLDQTPLERGMAPLLNLGYLEYSWLLEHYRGLVGADRVTAVPLEALRRPTDWADRWSRLLDRPVDPDWFGTTENAGMSALAGTAKRFANFLIPAAAEPNRTRTGSTVNRLAHQVDRHLPETWRRQSDARLEERIAELVGDRFVADNRRLATLLGEDWSGYGYRS